MGLFGDNERIMSWDGVCCNWGVWVFCIEGFLIEGRDMCFEIVVFNLGLDYVLKWGKWNRRYISFIC
ncbi:hypothetical protein, partial [Bacillus thuringiensis]|uniref:hypothetical protein n=1 Tax=Bacillus thuringiensis TaxID=1428 RepID=UPI001C930875